MVRTRKIPNLNKLKILTNTQEYKANHCTVRYYPEGILISTLADDVELSIEDVIDQRKLYYELTKGQPHVILVIAGHHTSATKEARDYAATHPVPGRLAEAIIIKSISVRILGNVYINFHKPTVPTKMFNKEEDAIEWLSKFLKIDKNKLLA